MRTKKLYFLSVGASALVGAGVGYGIGLFHRKPLSTGQTLEWVAGKDNFPPNTDWGNYAARAYNNAVVSERVTEGYISSSSLNLLQKACKIDPDNHVILLNRIFALLNLADQELKAGNRQAADELINQAQQAAQQPKFSKDKKHTVNALYGLGYAYQRRATLAKKYSDKKGFIDNAVETYIRAFQEKPNKIAACLVGEAYLDLIVFAKESKLDLRSEVEKSIHWFQKAIALDSEYGLAHFRAGQACILAGKVGEAKSHLIKSFELYSKDPIAFPKEYRSSVNALLEHVPEFEGREEFIKPFIADKFNLHEVSSLNLKN